MSNQALCTFVIPLIPHYKAFCANIQPPILYFSAAYFLCFTCQFFAFCVADNIETDRLFTKENGEPQHPNTTYHWLERFCERKGLPFYGLHTFRHLFASLLVNGGVDIVTVSGALGHSTVSTTSNIYCHMLENSRARVSDTITDALNLKNKHSA